MIETAGTFILILVVAVCFVGADLTQAAIAAAAQLPDIDISASHAVQRHGGQAIAVRLATNCYDYDYKFEDPNTGRTAFCIEFEDDGDIRIGLRIADKIGDKYQEVTAFIRRGRTTFDQFVEYMARRGYRLSE